MMCGTTSDSQLHPIEIPHAPANAELAARMLCLFEQAWEDTAIAPLEVEGTSTVRTSVGSGEAPDDDVVGAPRRRRGRRGHLAANARAAIERGEPPLWPRWSLFQRVRKFSWYACNRYPTPHPLSP